MPSVNVFLQDAAVLALMTGHLHAQVTEGADVTT